MFAFPDENAKSDRCSVTSPVETSPIAQKIVVGIGDFGIGQTPLILETYSLGSCVGIALYDPVTKIGALAHILLPESSQSHNSANPYKFADTALKLVVEEMARKGAIHSRLIAKIAGGASMFTAAVQDPVMAIGLRNVEAVKLNLKTLNIPIVAEDTGGSWGRTMIFHLETGIVTIKSAFKGTKEI